MLYIKIDDREYFNELDNTFINIKGTTIQLEHSLVSISKWESKWKKSFLNPTVEKTIEETMDYIKCMTITQNVNDEVYKNLSIKNINEINKYIEDPMTATTINSFNDTKSSKEIITSELIYYWMIALTIPMECQKWHINRLLMLIKVCNVKNTPPKKMNNRDIMNRNKSLNAARRAKYNTSG